VIAWAKAPASNMDIEMLMHAVYQRPVLWDTSTEEYKNKKNKTTAWGEVACAVPPI
jgi:hypothetical protein